MNTNTSELKECYFAAKSVARKAGDMILRAFHRPKQIHTKDGISSDLVTVTDQAVEEFVKKELTLNSPWSMKFFGEEESAKNGIKDHEMGLHLTDDPTWIIDPVDGTTNFCHSVPWCCISIGLAIQKRPVVGVIFNPMLNEMFSAMEGDGAYLNDEPIHTSGLTRLSDSLVSGDFPTKRQDLKNIDNHLRYYRNLLVEGNVHSLRNMGSCALDMCSVACGRMDIHFSLSIHPWDVCGASVIVSEAGGVVSDPLQGEKFSITSGRVMVGASSELVENTLRIFES